MRLHPGDISVLFIFLSFRRLILILLSFALLWTALICLEVLNRINGAEMKPYVNSTFYFLASSFQSLYLELRCSPSEKCEGHSAQRGWKGVFYVFDIWKGRSRKGVICLLLLFFCLKMLSKRVVSFVLGVVW